MKIPRWDSSITSGSFLLLAALTLTSLGPFVGKAFHMDDPLFVWSARQIQSHPFDFYGFDVNWDGRNASMANVTQNPPLGAYYLALVGSVLGWSEIALHIGCLPAAFAVVLGTCFLARQFGSYPLLAALLTGTAPVFVLSSTNVMTDTLMLAFWVWAMVCWMAGLRDRNWTRLFLASLLITAAALTKYFAVSLIPLLLVYSLFKQRRAGWWLAGLLSPLLPLALYQWLTSRWYGQGLLLNAIHYAVHLRVGGGWPAKLLTGLAFVGGGNVVLLAAAPLLWGWKRSLILFPAVLLAGCLILAAQRFGVFSVVEQGSVKWGIVIQMALWTAMGASLLVLVGADFLAQRTPESILLLLWIAGTFIFTCLLNWTVSGRNILPMVPAISVVLMRRMEQRGQVKADSALRRWAGPLAISLGIALLVARADYQLAGSSRIAASELTQRLAATAASARFEGHWGFQYYMQEHGAVPVDRQNPQFVSSEAVVIPVGNSYLFPLPEKQIAPWFEYRLNASTWLATMNGFSGAGFYSDGWGPLPFAFGPVSPEKFLVYRVK
jgi:4-amino-4-deoxy-L-arabinose transferase-like glycosyltransferase